MLQVFLFTSHISHKRIAFQEDPWVKLTLQTTTITTTTITLCVRMMLMAVRRYFTTHAAVQVSRQVKITWRNWFFVVNSNCWSKSPRMRWKRKKFHLNLDHMSWFLLLMSKMVTQLVMLIQFVTWSNVLPRQIWMINWQSQGRHFSSTKTHPPPKVIPLFRVQWAKWSTLSRVKRLQVN